MITPTAGALADFQSQPRLPHWRWWRPWVSLALLIMMVGAVLAVTSAFFGVADAAGWVTEDLAETPADFALTVLPLILLIPVTVLSMAAPHRMLPGWCVSVVGRIRWRWWLLCAAAVAPIWLITLGIAVALGEFTGGPHRWWFVLIPMVLVLIPFQAAGEEFLFRGFLMQWVGSVIGHRRVALVVAMVLSAVTFGLVHGSFDGWILADLGVTAVAWVWITWRTGGLEAAAAIHAVNNVTLMCVGLVFGGFAEGFIGEDTTGDPIAVLITLAQEVVACTVIVLLARRRGIGPRRPADADPADFPALFAPRRVDYANADIQFAVGPHTDALVTRLHLIALDHRDRVLVCETADWRFLPGGTREPDETLHQLTRRELLEEAGAVVLGPVEIFAHEVAVTHDPEPYRPYFPYPTAQWAYGVCRVRQMVPPTCPPDGEQITGVHAMAPAAAADWLAVHDQVHADVVRWWLATGAPAPERDRSVRVGVLRVGPDGSRTRRARG